MTAHNYIAVILFGVLMFLSAASGAWSIEQNFDEQAVGERCSPFFDSATDITVSETQSVSGRNSCKFAIKKGENGWGGGFVNPTALHDGDDLWVRFRLYVPRSFNYDTTERSSGHLKFVRVTMKSADDVVGRLDWLWSREGSNPFYIQGLERDLCTSNCNFRFGSSSDGPVRGVWETYEMHVRFDHMAADEGGKGRVLFWKNGKLIDERTDRPTMWPDAVNVVSVLFFSYWNGNSPATQHLYFEDLIATNVIPSAKDVAGNPFIGVGDYEFVAPPSVPTSVDGKEVEAN